MYRYAKLARAEHVDITTFEGFTFNINIFKMGSHSTNTAIPEDVTSPGIVLNISLQNSSSSHIRPSVDFLRCPGRPTLFDPAGPPEEICGHSQQQQQPGGNASRPPPSHQRHPIRGRLEINIQIKANSFHI
jgi:hypothetical protein